MEVLLWLTITAVALLMAMAAYMAGRRARYAIKTRDVLFDLSPDPMVLVDDQGIIRQANVASHKLLGYSPNSLNGESVDILVPDSIRPQHQHLVTLFFTSHGGRTMNNRIWIRGANGRKFNGEIHLAMVEVNDESMALATIRDTSALWREERKLREQRKAYDELFELAYVGICKVSLGGRFLRINQHLCELLGYSREEMMELCFQDITHEEDLQEDVENVNRLLQGTTASYSMEKRYINSRGQDVWANLTVSLIRDEQDFPDYFISVIQDITQRKQSEDLLQKSETKFRTMAETIQSVVWMATPQLDQILFVNEAVETVWGRNYLSFYNSPGLLFDAIHEEDRGQVLDAIQKRSDGHWKIQYRVIHPEKGIRHIFDTGTEVVGEKGQADYVVGLASDITDRVETQLELEKALQKEKEATERLNQLVRTDPLTGCLNRQALYEELDNQLELYNRYKTPSSILFIDLNDFKEINDSYGHIAGDETLRALANHINSHIRVTDILARYAGDEFVVVLPQTNVREATQAAANLRGNVLTHTSQGRDFHVHFSIGVAFVGYPDVRNASSWIEIADQAMYLDKTSNRGRSDKDTPPLNS
ncbi:MAG: hypothetical protein CMI02_09720 [Oceanospirillaceae bacterium]|nr:hypothetical protein [Oceanospirillaceae bacterium]MBT12301.1 hypothetical protein [Oceanospirillaceae bacterium]|tara:strand:+ start:49621 stop:51396 length:1776 start_codon:yes stop_codon:yes gene_type:complete